MYIMYDENELKELSQSELKDLSQDKLKDLSQDELNNLTEKINKEIQRRQAEEKEKEENDTYQRNCTIFFLRHLYKLKYSEIAKVFNISNCRASQIYEKQSRIFLKIMCRSLNKVDKDFKEVTKHDYHGNRYAMLP